MSTEPRNQFLKNLKLKNVVMGTSDFFSWDHHDLTNFTYLPDLIRYQVYHFSNATVKQWCKKDSLSAFLVKILPMKALGGGFDITLKDGKPWNIWEQTWKPELQRTDFWKCFKKGWIYRSKYGLSLLHFDGIESFQVISGAKVRKVEVDEFNEPTGFILEHGNTPLDIDNTYWIRNEGEEDEPKGVSYLEDIFDHIVYIKWMGYSMCESSAAEGSKFLMIGTKGADAGKLSVLHQAVQGISSRKGLFYDQDLVPIPPQVVNTQLSNVIPLHIAEEYKAISLKCLVPEDILTGIHAYRSGGETNVGSLYEAYAQIQHEAEDALIQIFCKMFHEQRKVFAQLKFVWYDQQRMGELQEEQVKLVKAQRIGLELRYKLLSEVREAEDLPVTTEMAQFVPSQGIQINVKGLEYPNEPEQSEEEEIEA